MLENQRVRDHLFLYPPRFGKCNPADEERLARVPGIFKKKGLEPFPHLPGFRSEALFELRDVAAVTCRSDRYSFNVNQVDSDFMPFRSMLAPSHTAKAIGTDIPALNWTSFASPLSNVRFTTTRHVGPE